MHVREQKIRAYLGFAVSLQNKICLDCFHNLFETLVCWGHQKKKDIHPNFTSEIQFDRKLFMLESDGKGGNADIK